MGRYDRYVLSQLLVLFGFFSLVLISVYWINQAVDLFDSILADGQTLAVFLEFTALSLPRIMVLVLPVSAFVAVLYILNRMVTESELVVLQTSGLGTLRLLRPVMVFSLFLAALIAVPAHVLAPAAMTRLNDRSNEVSRDMVGQFLTAGEFIHPADGITVFVGEITELGEFRDLFLHDRSDPDLETTYTAESALLVRTETGPRLVMFDGLGQSYEPATGRLSIVSYQDFTYDLAALIEVPETRSRDVREFPTSELLRATEADAEALGSTLLRMRFVAHDRIVKGLFGFLIPIIGAAAMLQGTFSRFGAWPQVMLAVLLMIPLQMLWNISTSPIDDLDAMWMAYIQPGLGALIALALIIRSMRPRRRRRTQREAAPA